MNKNLLPYYISRTIFSIAFAGLFYATGSSLWGAVGLGVLLLALFLWAPHCGRYSVHPEYGVTALRRDERSQAINDKAARNAFVVIMLLIGGAGLYFGAAGVAAVSYSVLKALIIIGVLVYYASDIWLRAAQR